MKRRTALQALTTIMASYFQVPLTSQEHKDFVFLDRPQKIYFELQLADIKEIRVRWGESAMVIQPQELWDALHRNE